MSAMSPEYIPLDQHTPTTQNTATTLQLTPPSETNPPFHIDDIEEADADTSTFIFNPFANEYDIPEVRPVARDVNLLAGEFVNEGVSTDSSRDPLSQR